MCRFKLKFFLTVLSMWFSLVLPAQELNTVSTKLSLQDAFDLALQRNKKLQIGEINVKVASLYVQERKQEKLPELALKSKIAILDNIHQYEGGLGHSSTSYSTPRIKYDVNLDASVPIYTGGKLKYEDKQAEILEEISELKHIQSARDLKMQIIHIYLKGFHLSEQMNLLREKVKEDSTIIKLTEKLKSNGLVTYNDVLRTKLQLSNHEMDYSELSSEFNILKNELKTLLVIPSDVSIEMDMESLIDNKDHFEDFEVLARQSFANNERIEIAEKTSENRKIDQKIVRANVLPKVSAFAEYGYNYPNFMFFPPVEHLYRFGMAGVSINIPLSNLYTNKVKSRKAQQRFEQSRLAIEQEKEELSQEIYAAHQRLLEADRKISIAEQAIQQAAENYRIVKVKYNNQLSLITELVDADNAYLTAQTTLIGSKINKQLKQYQLEYLLGNI